MTQKEVTQILYNEINEANRIESKIINSNNFLTFKSSTEEKFMVCVLNENTPSSHSEIFNTKDECDEWITQNS